MRASHILENEPQKMFISMFRTAERENKYNWIGPLVDSSIYFYKKQGSSINIQTLEDAKKVGEIATRHAGLVFSTLKTHGFTNLDSRAVTGMSIYKKLILGRTDLAISDSSMGVSHILKSLHYPTDILVKTKVKVISATLYIAASKDIPIKEVNRWQTSLNKLKESKAYLKMLNSYNN